jgi:hypothetical protein
LSTAGGSLFAASGSKLHAFDSTLATGCSASAPRTCGTRWTATPSSPVAATPVIAAGKVFVNTANGAFPVTSGLEAFDAAGIEGCNQTTHVCKRLWQTAIDADHPTLIASASANLLVVSGSPLVGPGPLDVGQVLRFYDVNGTVDCAGSPRTCTPVGSIELGRNPSIFAGNQPVIAEGLVVTTNQPGIGTAVVFGLG